MAKLALLGFSGHQVSEAEAQRTVILPCWAIAWPLARSVSDAVLPSGEKPTKGTSRCDAGLASSGIYSHHQEMDGVTTIGFLGAPRIARGVRREATGGRELM